jgi:hypothetical protein
VGVLWEIVKGGRKIAMAEYIHGVSQKRPKNNAEAMCFDELSQKGWAVTKRGWPDFFCINEKGEICLVEVKPRHAHPLKQNQETVMKQLSKYGVKCFKWTPDGGFEVVKYEE